MRIPNYKKYTAKQIKVDSSNSHIPGSFEEWFYRYGDPSGHFSEDPIIDDSEYTYSPFDLTNVKDNLTTPQKMIIFRFVWNLWKAKDVKIIK